MLSSESRKFYHSLNHPDLNFDIQNNLKLKPDLNSLNFDIQVICNAGCTGVMLKLNNCINTSNPAFFN